MAWLLKTQLVKSVIRWQDRLKLYTYADWIRENEKFSGENFAGQSGEEPVGTFLVVVDWQSDVDILKKVRFTLSSIRAQKSTDWECILCVAGQHAAEFADSWGEERANPRITLLQTQTTDLDSILPQILPQARARWIIRTRPGDAHSNVLLNFLASQNGEIVYWDEDVLVRGRRSRAFFKPDWSPELWLSVDLLHCSAIQKDFASRAVAEGGPAGILPGCLARAKEIRHIPAVLTHCQAAAWENDDERTAHARDVAVYLELKGVSGAKINGRPDGSLRVQWPDPSEKISIIIPNKNKFSFLQRCLQSMFLKTAHENYEVIIVDDHSTDEDVLDFYQSITQSGKEVRIVEGISPFNYSQACNLGAKNARGAYLLFLNNDVEITGPGWLSELLQFASLAEVGVVGGKLLYPDQTIQHAGIVVGLEGHAHHVFQGQSQQGPNVFGAVDWVRNFSAVTGACMMLRAQVFQEIGGFDENFSLVFNDVEICTRAIQSGYRVVYTPDSSLIHHEGQSRGHFIPREDILLGEQKLTGIISGGDPYYNKSLSLAWHVPTFRRRWEGSSAERLKNITRYFSKI